MDPTPQEPHLSEPTPQEPNRHESNWQEGYQFVLAYVELAGHWLTAIERNQPVYTQAISYQTLRAMPIGDAILLTMFSRAHIEYLQARGDAASGTWAVSPRASVHFNEQSWFVMTEEGEMYAGELVASVLPDEPEERFPTLLNDLFHASLRPNYDRKKRIFRWGNHILKHFRQPAGNQEVVLCTAEELKWDEWFDDPLPPVPEKSPKQRLHDTIQDLNRKQKVPLVQFKGDGTGTQVGWELR